MSTVIITSADEFNNVLKENAKVVIQFHATWCGPCKLISPKFEAFSLEYPGIKFLKIDVDDVADVSEKCGIRAMPTFQTYINGEKKGEVLGANPTNLKKLIDELAAL
ncbi:hypothetical protein DFQ26_009858 [Actinomortierella ambigua]|nr:hypothetical protein DFQ26_009858 [Actinomortierella ambigua]